jgi:hypothetical protein
MDKIQDRMMEIAKPVTAAIHLTDDPNELLMLACVMLQHVREIYDDTLGVEGRKKMFKDYV